MRKDIKNETLAFPLIIPQEKNKSSPNGFLILAFTGICGGFSAILLGFIFTIIHAAIKDDAFFNELGTVLIFISIPMLLGGGHFLDKAADKRK